MKKLFLWKDTFEIDYTIEQYNRYCNSNNKYFGETGYIGIQTLFKSIIPNMLPDKCRDLIKDEIDILGFIMCMIASIIISYTCNRQIKNFDMIYSFAILYMLADNYMDDKDVIISDKKMFIDIIRCVLKSDTIKFNVNENGQSRINTITYYIGKILMEKPSSKEYLTNCFECNVESMKQQDDSIDIQSCLNVTHKKAVAMLNCVLSLVDGNQYIGNSSASTLAYCGQLCDDIIDTDKDREDNIDTIATISLKETGSLDKAIMYTIAVLSTVEDTQLYFFINYFLVLLATEMHNSMYVGIELKTILKKYNNDIMSVKNLILMIKLFY